MSDDNEHSQTDQKPQDDATTTIDDVFAAFDAAWEPALEALAAQPLDPPSPPPPPKTPQSSQEWYQSLLDDDPDDDDSLLDADPPPPRAVPVADVRPRAVPVLNAKRSQEKRLKAPAARSKHAPDLAADEALFLANEIIQRRIAGMDYFEIATELNVPASEVARAARIYLNYITEHIVEAAAQLRTVELARLDKLHNVLWKKAVEEADMKAIAMLLKIIALRADLGGVGQVQSDTGESVRVEFVWKKADKIGGVKLDD